MSIDNTTKDNVVNKVRETKRFIIDHDKTSTDNVHMRMHVDIIRKLDDIERLLQVEVT